MRGTAQSIENMLEGLDLAHLSREEIEPILAQGLEAGVFLVLTLSTRMAELQNSAPVTPSTPSSQIPPFKKANTTNKRHKTPRPQDRPSHQRPNTLAVVFHQRQLDLLPN